MYTDRVSIYREIEDQRNSRLLVYVTGDRRGQETRIANDALDLFIRHLDPLNHCQRVSLYLYTQGGDVLTAWSLVNLICQYCNELEVIVPSCAHSAGTLICLGARTIVMTKQATLGPIDPSVTTPLCPAIPGAPPNARAAVSVEAINGYIELAKEIGIGTSDYLTTILSTLTSQVHPLVLGQVFRTRSQIRMLGRRLLSGHMSEDHKIEKILSFLCSESGSHDYTIYRREASERLGLNIESPDERMDTLINRAYHDIASELELHDPYDPALLLADRDQREYELRRALVESTIGGGHRFVSRGVLSKITIPEPGTGRPQEAFHDRRTYEGWQYENPPLSH